MFIRHENSVPVMYSAPESTAKRTFCSTIADEMSFCLIENVPPNPQQVVLSSISTISSPFTFLSNVRGSSFIPYSLNAEHESWMVTFPLNVAPKSVTFSTLTRKSQMSNTLDESCSAACRSCSLSNKLAYLRFMNPVHEPPGLTIILSPSKSCMNFLASSWVSFV